MASPQATSSVEPTYQISDNVTDHEEGHVTIVKDRAFEVITYDVMFLLLLLGFKLLNRSITETTGQNDGHWSFA